MGRSRFHSAEEDPSQRSRRKKNASSENSESSNAGQGTSDGKALYHCNYCNKDITGKIRIKCCICPDFDLCVECFSVGAEVYPHKSNHNYRVMDNLSFPLICPDWNADEEILLLEGIEMYGLGNWTEVAEHVGTKSKEQCIYHYNEIYMKSPNFPLPDMSHVVGKNRKELLAMAKGQNEDKKELNGKEESPFSPRIKAEELQKSGSSSRLLSSLADCGTNAANVKLEDPPLERPFKGKKPVSSNDGPSLVEMSGYNAKRNEFDTEYDNDAEQLIADMEFKVTDTADERELKLRVLRIYSKRLDERQRRKDFVVERSLLYTNPFEKDLSAEEKVICRSFDKLMRFTTKEKHEELIRTAISENRTRKRLEELREAQRAGCRTQEDVDRYLERKKRKEEEEAVRRGKENVHTGPNAESKPVDSSSGGDTGNGTLNGADLLSGGEKQMCTEIGLTAAYYLKMQEIMSIQIFRRIINKKSDAYHLFKSEPAARIDAVYDMLVKKGIAPP